MKKKMEGGATPNALLGLLSLGPMSGYDIRQLIPRSIGHFWSESYGQIYPGLKRLSAAGFVEKKTERQKRKVGSTCLFADCRGTRAAAGLVELAGNREASVAIGTICC